MSIFYSAIHSMLNRLSNQFMIINSIKKKWFSLEKSKPDCVSHSHVTSFYLFVCESAAEAKEKHRRGIDNSNEVNL